MNTHAKHITLLALAALLWALFAAPVTRAQKPELVLQTGHNEVIRALAISPDGKYLASAGLDRTIIVWDIAKGIRLTSLRGHDEPIFTLAFSPDGSTLASGSSDGIVCLWDVAKGVKVDETTRQKPGITSVAFSPDGRMLAISCVDKKTLLWRITEKSGIEITGYRGPVTQIAFSPDGKYLASTGGDKSDGVAIWDIAADKLKAGWIRDKGFTSLAFSPDGRYFAAACADESITVWDTHEWKEKSFILPMRLPAEIRKQMKSGEGIDSRALGRLFENSGYVTGALVFTSNKELAFADGFRVRTWDVEADKEIHSREIKSDSGSYVVTADKGSKFLVFNNGADIRLLDLRTKQIREFKSDADYIDPVGLIFGGRVLAAVYGNYVNVWNYNGSLTEAAMNRVQVGLASRMGTLVPSTDEFARHYDETDDPNKIELLDLVTWKVRAFLEGHTKPILSTTIHPDQNTLASCSEDDTIKLWDVKRRALLKTIKHAAYTVAFSARLFGTQAGVRRPPRRALAFHRRTTHRAEEDAGKGLHHV